jgi:glycerophosphoryl diester phosphodiesterase
VKDAAILVHGHRGARARRPENTIAGFEYAIAAGVDAIELDVTVTKDDVVVVSHDPAPNPEICLGPREPVPIRTLRWRELREWDCGSIRNPAFPDQAPVPGSRIPSLDDVLSLSPHGAFDFNIEAKIFPDQPHLTPPPEEFARLALDCIRRHGLESRVIFQSFDFRILQSMKRLAPEVRLAALYEDGPESFLEIAHRAGTGIVAPELSLVTREKVEAAHAARLQVIPWTANTRAEWDVLAAAGIDAIISDDPAALLDYLRERKLR